MKQSIDGSRQQELARAIAAIDAQQRDVYPGESPARQPVHTVYGGAHLFRAETASRLGTVALRSLQRYAPDAATLATAIGMAPDGPIAEPLYERVVAKLQREPVEDFRIDFEDGYGTRPDAEEDACAVSAAHELARGMAAGTLPPFTGIRIKALSGDAGRRGARTLDLFVTQVLEASGGALPAGFVVTLPKVTVPEQVRLLVGLFETIERAHGLADGALKLEIMVETTQSILDAAGRSCLLALVAAADGRCTGAHFGVYDYTAACGITAQYQTLDHPACDFARHMMQVALGGTGVWLSDGATNVIPVETHADPADNREAVRAAWRLHYEHCRHSLRHGFYQGWDLNPAQLPTRYAAVYAFFLESLAAASQRLHNFIGVAAQATLVGEVFDDAATGQGLLNFFLRGLNCGAITAAEALATGLSIEELRTRSFAAILAGRRG